MQGKEDPLQGVAKGRVREPWVGPPHGSPSVGQCSRGGGGG